MAPPAADLTTLDEFFKTVFVDNVLTNLALHDGVVLRHLPRFGNFTGESHREPIMVRNGVGASSSFEAAQNNYKPSKLFKWTLERKHAYRFVTIDDETIHASKGSEAAFLETKANEMKGAVEELGEKLAREIMGPGSGSLGVIGTSGVDAVNNTITLESPEDVDKFWEGMVLVAAADPVSGALRDGGDTITVTGKDNDGGKILVDNTALIAGLTDGDHLFVQGDRDDSGPQVITGIAAYIPLTAPSSSDATLNGITGAQREAFPEELAGWRLTSFPGSIEESIGKLDAKMKRRKRSGKVVVLSFENWRKLSLELGLKPSEQGMSAKFGVPSIKYVAPGSTLEVIADPFMPEDRGYILDLGTWKLKHLLNVPHIVTTDGLQALRISDADGVEMRWRYWAELVCINPLENGVFAINY